MISRRDFVRAAMLISGAGTAGTVMRPFEVWADVQAAAAPREGLLTLTLADYPELNLALGSVRLGVNAVDSRSDTPLGRYYPLLLNRGTTNDYYLLDTTCPHSGCVVNPFRNGVCGCDCHGSQFEINGNLRRGPASRALTRFPFHITQGKLTARIPEWHTDITLRKANPGTRLELTFFAWEGVIYQIMGTPSLRPGEVVWTPVSFAPPENPNGPATATSYEGGGSLTSLYVPASNGMKFCKVTMAVGKV